MKLSLKTLCIFIIMMTITSFLLVEAQSSTIVCPVNDQKFLSIDRGLLPVSNVRATSEDTLFNPVENFITSDIQSNPPWCSATNIEHPNVHFVEVNFTEPVVITLLESSGLVDGFVNNFMIEYVSLDDSSDVQLYGFTESPQEFHISTILLTDAYFTLERPIVAQSFKFRINDAVLDQDGRICWELLIYGCTLDNAREISEDGETRVTTQPMVTSTAPPDTTPSGTTSTEATECPSVFSGTTENKTDTDILIIVIPVALATIVVVLVIVIVGILVCLCAAKRKRAKEPDYETVTVRMLNNRTRNITGAMESDTPKDSLSFHYDSPRLLSYDVPRASIRSRPTSTGSNDVLSSTFEIKNPIYSLKRSLSAGTRHDNYQTDDCNDYEMIPDALPGKEGFHVPLVQQPSNDRPHDIKDGRSRDTPGNKAPDLPPNQPHTYSVVDKKKKAQARADKEGSQEKERKTNTNLEDKSRNGEKESVQDSKYNKLAEVGSTNPMSKTVHGDRDICNDIDTP